MPSRREKPLEELKLEIDGLALPSRVARAAQMMADTLAALGGDAGQVTMVVSNRDMRAALRGWDELGAERVRTVVRLVENPLEAVQEAPELRPAARALGDGARDLASVGGRFRRNRKRIRRLDEAFARVMLAAAQESSGAPRVLEGTTEIYTSVLRVGRLREGGEAQARLFIGGAHRDVDVDDRFIESYFDAAKEGGFYRVRLRARWYVVPDATPVIDHRSAVALSIEPWNPITGAQAMRALRGLVSADDADEMLANLTGGGDA